MAVTWQVTPGLWFLYCSSSHKYVRINMEQHWIPDMNTAHLLHCCLSLMVCVSPFKMKRNTTPPIRAALPALVCLACLSNTANWQRVCNCYVVRKCIQQQEKRPFPVLALHLGAHKGYNTRLKEKTLLQTALLTPVLQESVGKTEVRLQYTLL